MFGAFDARTGKVLWEHPTNSGVIGQASSFTLNGRQYVAVQSGWGIDARGMQNRLNAIRRGEFPEVPEDGAVWVFALGDWPQPRRPLARHACPAALQGFVSRYSSAV